MILGMPGPWAQDDCEHSDHYTTKIGGLPDWPIPAGEINPELIKCGICGGDLALVAQVYAPLKTDMIDIEERTVYIFGCPMPNCGMSPLSWCTIRIQKRTPMGDALSSNGIKSPTEEEHNNSSSRDEWWEGGGGGGGEGVDVQELGRALMEAGCIAAHPHPATQTQSQNENEADIDSLEMSVTVPLSVPVLPCFYMYLQNELRPSHGSRAISASHASVDYQGRQNYDAEDAGEETWEGEEYEHARALFVDRTYLKFKKRLDCYPEQCFRYCFRGRPLLANKDQSDPGVCGLCQGPRVYEMQLMPPLLYYLQQACKDSLSLYSAKNWEWLTLFVYTCAQSCSGATGDSNGEKEWIVLEEATTIQYET